MASLANTYFKKGVPSEQNLVQGLWTESVQILGHTFYYLPRKLQKRDNLFGEDVLSAFEVAMPIEMYIDNFNNWEGDQEIISKFGLEIRKQMVLTVSRTRWAEEVANIASNMWVTSRPQEGDLVYDPMSGALMEIKQADHDTEFYQIHKNYRYQLTCELFRYSQENITTGIADIDISAPLDLMNYQLRNEDGTIMLFENGYTIINNTDEESLNPRSDNTFTFNQESIFSDFSVDNPFND
jgi:hypothetical protein